MLVDADRVEVAVTRKGKCKEKKWHTVPVWVVSLAAPKCEPIGLETSANVTTCCCINKGKIKLTVGISNNVLVPNEPVTFSLDIDNASEVSVRSVQLQLVTVVGWVAHGHQQRQTFKTMVTNVNMTAGPNTAGPEARITATIPSVVIPSLSMPQGGTIDVASHFEVKAMTDGYTKNPSLRIPVRLFCLCPPVPPPRLLLHPTGPPGCPCSS